MKHRSITLILSLTAGCITAGFGQFSDRPVSGPHNQIQEDLIITEEPWTTDVLVVGGTTSGTSAGIAAARCGARTIIVEETPWLGGMLTAQGVGATDGNHELGSGIWFEFREHLRKHYGGQGALWTGWVSATQFEPHVGDSIFKAMASREDALKVLYGYRVKELIADKGRVLGAIFEDYEGEAIEIHAKVSIDATDLGDCLPLAGAGYRLGMDSRADTGEHLAPEQANEIVQDLTWVAILKDYGEDADVLLDKPEGYNTADFEGCCPPSLDSLQADCENMITYGKMPNGKYMINWPKKGNDVYLNVVEMDYEQRDFELEKAKNYTLRFVYHIQTALGMRHLGLADDEFSTQDRLAYKPYHREGRRLRGLAFLTLNDVVNRYTQPLPLYRTGISVGDYPVDHHHAANPDSPVFKFPPIPSFNIPLGSLIPEAVDGLIVSDKAISVSNLINGSTRLQPVVLLTGQAAGTLAALSAFSDAEPREVPVRQVQQKLLEQKAYLMPLFDIKADDPDFEAIQRITSTGILKTEGEPFHWANRTWFRPEEKANLAEIIEGLSGYYKIDKGFCQPYAAKSQTDAYATWDAFKAVIEECRREASAKPDPTGTEAIPLPDYPADKTLTRREVAKILDKYLNPFLIPIGHDGNVLR